MGSPSLPGKKVERKREVIGDGEYRREEREGEQNWEAMKGGRQNE